MRKTNKSSIRKTTTKKPLPTAEALAEEFASVLRKWLTVEEWREMRRRNAKYVAENDHGICASHDFCDANMAMLSALENLGVRGRLPYDETDPRGEVGSLWSAAWDVAMKKYLAAKPRSTAKNRF